MFCPNLSDFELAHTFRDLPLGHMLGRHTTVVDALRQNARHRGVDPVLTAVSSSGEAQTLTYRELDVLSRRLAAWLRRELPLAPGDVVALAPTNDVRSVVSIFAVLRAGGSILFLNPADPADRLRQQAEAVGARTALNTSSMDESALPGAVRAPEPVAWSEADENAPEPPLDPMADAQLFGTSGSTAVSKLVVQSHYGAAVNAEAVRLHHRLEPGDRFLGCLPIHHVNGLHFTIFATVAAGAHAILADGFRPFSYPSLIERYRPRIASVVPSILEALVEAWRRPNLPTDFGYFVSAAAPLTSSVATVSTP